MLSVGRRIRRSRQPHPNTIRIAQASAFNHRRFHLLSRPAQPRSAEMEAIALAVVEEEPARITGALRNGYKRCAVNCGVPRRKGQRLVKPDLLGAICNYLGSTPVFSYRSRYANTLRVVIGFRSAKLRAVATPNHNCKNLIGIWSV